MPVKSSSVLTALCVGAFLAFALQQVVIGHALGVNLSLGSMLLRVFVVISSVWMLYRHGIPRVLRGPAMAVGLCLAVLLVSTMVSTHRDIALRFALRYALELGLLWSVLNLSLAFPALARSAVNALLILLWGGLLLSLGVHLDLPGANSLALLFYSPATLNGYAPRASGFYEHPALFGAAGVMTLAMVMQLHSHGQCGMRALLMATLGCLLALLACGTRNPLLGLLVIGTATLWRLRHHRHARRLAVLAGLTLIALVAVAIISRHAELTSASREGAFTAFSLGRPYIWAAAWKAWLSQPWFGLGPGVFQFLIPDFAGGRFLRGELHAHNLPLGLLSELGLIGALSFLVLGITVWRPWIGKSSPGRSWALISLLTLLSFGLFDYYQPFYGFALHGAVMIGLLYANHVSMPELISSSTEERPVQDMFIPR